MTKTPLDSRQLVAFALLARNGSFTQTARELFLTQSAISHAMRALEEDVGCRLFDRVGKKIMLTQAGEQLTQHAERILAEMATAREGLTQLGKWGKGRLRIGAPETLCTHLLPGVLRSFQTEFPGSSISLIPTDAREAVGLLEDGRVDLVLSLELPPDERFEFSPLFSDEMLFIAAPSHPWAKNGNAPRVEIPSQQVIVYSKQSQTWRLIDQYFRADHLVLHTVVELGSVEAIKELLKLNLGVSILAPWVAAEEIKAGTLVAFPLGRRKLKREWGMLWWRGRRLTLHEETFVKLARAGAEKLAAERI